MQSKSGGEEIESGNPSSDPRGAKWQAISIPRFAQTSDTRHGAIAAILPIADKFQ